MVEGKGKEEERRRAGEAKRREGGLVYFTCFCELNFSPLVHEQASLPVVQGFPAS